MAAATGAGLVCAHAGGQQPRTRPHRVAYDDVVADVVATVTGLAERAVALGVRRDGVLIDPAHDFGKNTRHSLEVTRRLGELVATGWPVLVSLSRKDFVGETLDLPPDDRLEGTLAATAVSAWLGARVFRAHDVTATRRVLDTVAADPRHPPARPSPAAASPDARRRPAAAAQRRCGSCGAAAPAPSLAGGSRHSRARSRHSRGQAGEAAGLEGGERGRDRADAQHRVERGPADEAARRQVVQPGPQRLVEAVRVEHHHRLGVHAERCRRSTPRRTPPACRSRPAAPGTRRPARPSRPCARRMVVHHDQLVAVVVGHLHGDQVVAG